MAHRTKRSPAGQGGARGDDLVRKLDLRENSQTRRPPQGETAYDHGEPRVIDVYDGRTKLGSICIGHSIRAVDSDGLELGAFDTKDAARRAIMRHVVLASGRAE
jgi:hypothetical protein